MRKHKLKDYTNSEIGFLKIIGRYEQSDDDTAMTAKWTALCACGNQCVLEHKTVNS